MIDLDFVLHPAICKNRAQMLIPPFSVCILSTVIIPCIVKEPVLMSEPISKSFSVPCHLVLLSLIKNFRYSLQIAIRPVTRRAQGGESTSGKFPPPGKMFWT